MVDHPQLVAALSAHGGKLCGDGLVSHGRRFSPVITFHGDDLERRANGFMMTPAGERWAVLRAKPDESVVVLALEQDKGELA